MNYIELINRLWQSHEVNQLSTTEIALYFYLVKIFNSCHWADSVKRLNVKINADLNITYPTMCKARNRLKQIGLIDFKTKNGDSNTTYTLKNFLKVTNEVAFEVTNEVSDEVAFEVPFEINKTETETKQNNKDATASKASAPPFISEIENLSDGDLQPSSSEEHLTPPKDSRKKVAQKKESNAVTDNEICNKVVEYFNTNCLSLKPVKVLTDSRKTSILARFREYGNDTIFTVINNASSSKFLAGQNTKGWKADFDWIFKPTNFVKILEDKYSDDKSNTTSSTVVSRNYNEQIF